MTMYNFVNTCLLMLCSAILTSAGDAVAPSPRAIVERAIQAQGGKKNLLRIQNMTTKTRGTLVYGGETFEYSALRRIEIPNRTRLEMTLNADRPNKYTILVLNGSVGWQKIGKNAATEVGREDLANWVRGLWHDRVYSLLPILNDEEFSLKWNGEKTLSGKTLVGVMVTSKTEKWACELFFDKSTNLFARGVAKDNEGVVQEVRYFDYKDFDGLKFPTRWEGYKGTDKVREVHVIELLFHKQSEKSLFEKP
jgi:hypothetical protein